MSGWWEKFPLKTTKILGVWGLAVESEVRGKNLSVIIWFSSTWCVVDYREFAFYYVQLSFGCLLLSVHRRHSDSFI